MTEVGFEPTPPKRLDPDSSALDHSAIQSLGSGRVFTRHLHPFDYLISSKLSFIYLTRYLLLHISFYTLEFAFQQARSRSGRARS